MFYLLEKFGKYEDYKNTLGVIKSLHRYEAVLNEADEIRKWLLQMDVGRKPLDNSHRFKFKTLASEKEIRQLDFLQNCTTSRLVSARVSEFFQSNCPDSVYFFNTRIHTADAVIDDFKIMIFTAWANNLYDRKKTFYIDLGKIKYIASAAYYADCMQGRSIAVNADCPVDVLLSEDVAAKLRGQNLVLLGLRKPETVERLK